jgi:hypothetical protein
MMIVILTGVRWNLSDLHFFVGKDAENFFMYLLVICVFSFENCLIHFPWLLIVLFALFLKLKQNTEHNFYKSLLSNPCRSFYFFVYNFKYLLALGNYSKSYGMRQSCRPRLLLPSIWFFSFHWAQRMWGERISSMGLIHIPWSPRFYLWWVT